MNDKIIAVDFDGTLCESSYPQIGKPKIEIINRLKAEQEKGAKLILWTCRTGMLLKDAVDFCKKHNLIFDAVNKNIPSVIRAFGKDQRKVLANEYWDDRAVNPFKR